MPAGALPAYASVGEAESSNTLAGTFDIDVPAHNSGDLLLLQVLCRNNNNDGTLASINTAGWTQLGGAGNTYGGTQNARMGIGWKIGNGSETVVNVTTTGGTSLDRRHSRVYRFTAADSFATTAVANIGTPLTGTSTSSSMPTVNPGGALNRLAVTLTGLSTVSATFNDATGESGGDWTQPVAHSPAVTFGTIGIQVSDQSGGGEISGGTSTHGSGDWVTVGFTLEPAELGAGSLLFPPTTPSMMSMLVR